MRHKLPALAASCLAVLLAVALSVAAPQAQARPELLVCNGTQTASYDPPITNVSQGTTADITESYSPCHTPSDPALTNGDGSFSSHETASCTSLDESVDIATYDWNNGVSSTVLFADTTVARLADGTTDVTSFGIVVDGFGAGSAAAREVILPQPDVTACDGTGVVQENGTATLTFA